MLWIGDGSARTFFQRRRKSDCHQLEYCLQLQLQLVADHLQFCNRVRAFTTLCLSPSLPLSLNQALRSPSLSVLLFLLLSAPSWPSPSIVVSSMASCTQSISAPSSSWTIIKRRRKKKNKLDWIHGSAIDHLHNYGPEMRFGASPARIGCDVCISNSSFRFSSRLWNGVHCCFSSCSNLGRASPSLFSHSFPRSGELRKRWLLAIHQAD